MDTFNMLFYEEGSYMRYLELFWNCLYALTLGSLFGAGVVTCGEKIAEAFRNNRKEKEES